MKSPGASLTKCPGFCDLYRHKFVDLTVDFKCRVAGGLENREGQGKLGNLRWPGKVRKVTGKFRESCEEHSAEVIVI